MRVRWGRGIRGRARRRRGSATAPPTSTRTAPAAKTRTAPAPKRTNLAKPIAVRNPSRSNANPPTASTRRRKRAPSGVRAYPVRATAASVSFPSPMFFPLPGRTALIRRGLSPSSLGRSRDSTRETQSNECPPCARTRVLRRVPDLTRPCSGMFQQCPFLPGWRLRDAELGPASLLPAGPQSELRLLVREFWLQ